MDSGIDTDIGWAFHIPLAKKEMDTCPFKQALAMNYFLRAKNLTLKEIDFNTHLALSLPKRVPYN